MDLKKLGGCLHKLGDKYDRPLFELATKAFEAAGFFITGREPPPRESSVDESSGGTASVASVCVAATSAAPRAASRSRRRPGRSASRTGPRRPSWRAFVDELLREEEAGLREEAERLRDAEEAAGRRRPRGL